MGDCLSSPASTAAPKINDDTDMPPNTKKSAAACTTAEDMKPVPSPRATPDSVGKPEGSDSGKSFDEIYCVGQTLGKGAFSCVVEGTHIQSKTSFAIKVVEKKKLSTVDELALKDEIAVLKELNHTHIICLYDVFDEPDFYYLVTERMIGGELFDRIVTRSYYTELKARDVCKILFEAMLYCHSKNVAHRDLKPENLLLTSKSNDSELKIADFGFAKKVTPGSYLRTQCGTPGYVAPEILEGVPYGTKVDMWSLGVITYILLGGYPPFIEQNQRELFRKIRKGQYEFHDEYWDQVSTEAKDLIASMLTVNPTKRISAADALKSSWICRSDDDLAGKDLVKNLAELKKYHARRKFKVVVNALIAMNKITSLGENFQQNL